FRVDTNIASHDKVLALLDDRAPKALRYQALWSYVCAIGWSVDRETDGRIPTAALFYIHGNRQTAKLLTKYDLWHEEPTGYLIHNYAHRQPTHETNEIERNERRRWASRAACIRWHGPTCWNLETGCSRHDA